jgi:hypothetical protein
MLNGPSKTVGAQGFRSQGLIVETANADGDPAADGFFLNSWSLQEGVSDGVNRKAQHEGVDLESESQ